MTFKGRMRKEMDGISGKTRIGLASGAKRDSESEERQGNPCNPKNSRQSVIQTKKLEEIQ